MSRTTYARESERRGDSRSNDQLLGLLNSLGDYLYGLFKTKLSDRSSGLNNPDYGWDNVFTCRPYAPRMREDPPEETHWCDKNDQKGRSFTVLMQGFMNDETKQSDPSRLPGKATALDLLARRLEEDGHRMAVQLCLEGSEFLHVYVIRQERLTAWNEVTRPAVEARLRRKGQHMRASPVTMTLSEFQTQHKADEEDTADDGWCSVPNRTRRS